MDWQRMLESVAVSEMISPSGADRMGGIGATSFFCPDPEMQRKDTEMEAIIYFQTPVGFVGFSIRSAHQW